MPSGYVPDHRRQHHPAVWTCSFFSFFWSSLDHPRHYDMLQLTNYTLTHCVCINVCVQRNTATTIILSYVCFLRGNKRPNSMRRSTSYHHHHHHHEHDDQWGPCRTRIAPQNLLSVLIFYFIFILKNGISYFTLLLFLALSLLHTQVFLGQTPNRFGHWLMIIWHILARPN